jgi:hypothetical protein
MPTTSLSTQIISDELVARVNDGSMSAPANWGSRALYPGEFAARNWLAVVHEAEYPQNNTNSFGLNEMRLSALEDLKFDTFVSLGPGDGTLDVVLLDSLATTYGDRRRSDPKKRLKYIPVDISRTFLEMTISTLNQYAELPVGILCDFEGGQTFLENTLAQYATRPLVFGFLGGTVANIDVDLGAFFAGIRRMMLSNDHFLVDIPIAGPDWRPDTEPRLSAPKYTHACRRFLTHGLGVPHSFHGFDAFDKACGITYTHDAQSGAEVIVVKNPLNGRTVLNRRYRWKPLLQWMERQGFEIRFAKSSIDNDGGAFGMGVVLLATPDEKRSRMEASQYE